jgi:hypothetical protein
MRKTFSTLALAAVAVVLSTSSAHAAETIIEWHETPVVGCEQISIDPPATFTVTFHVDIDDEHVDVLASWGSHADPYIDTPAALNEPGPHHVHVYATATVSNIPGSTAVSNTADIDITCVELPTSTTTPSSSTPTTWRGSATSVSSVPAAQVLAAAQSDDELPFTGTPAENTAIVGAVVLAAGTAFVGGSKIRKRGRA